MTEVLSTTTKTTTPSTLLSVDVSSRIRSESDEKQHLDTFKTTMQSSNREGITAYTPKQINDHAERQSVIESIRTEIWKATTNKAKKEQTKTQRGYTITINGLSKLSAAMQASIENEIRLECTRQSKLRVSFNFNKNTVMLMS